MYSDGNCVGGGDFLDFVEVVCFEGVVLLTAVGDGALFSRILDLIFDRNARRSLPEGSFALSEELSLRLLSAIVCGTGSSEYWRRKKR
jgi:hypothetical protein